MEEGASGGPLVPLVPSTLNSIKYSQIKFSEIMTYVKVNVLKPGDNKGVGGDKKDKVNIFDWDDVKTNPPRDSKGITIAGNLVFLDGAYISKIYATQSTIKAGADSTGDPDAKGIEQTVEFSHPGDSVAIREFRANWMNKNIGIIIERCSSNQKNLYGTPCAPLQMVFKAEDDKDKNNTTFTFKSTQKGPDVADYQGTMAFDTVKGTAVASETEVEVVNGPGQYQLTSGVNASVIVVDLPGAINGEVYTLLGSGGPFPCKVQCGGSFILSNGNDWTALAGSQLTLMAYASTNGDLLYIEESRS